MISVGIVGSSGYVAGELIRLLVNHPQVEIDFLYSHSNAEKSVSDIHQDLFFLDQKLTNKINSEVDCVFLCLGHGNSRKFLNENTFSKETKIIDMSNDFRLLGSNQFKENEFKYGLVELNQLESEYTHIANPGCFATAIQLALLPLAAGQELKKDVHVSGITGATGAGKSLTETSNFSWRTNNVSIYKAFNHQHLDEVYQTIQSLQKSFNKEIHFVPLRGDFARGILISAYMVSDLDELELIKMYQDYYKDWKGIHISQNQVNLKQIVNTNYVFLQVQKINGKVLITAAIDNLLKGAAGQAIQNMNLLFGQDEMTSLKLKSTAF